MGHSEVSVSSPSAERHWMKTLSTEMLILATKEVSFHVDGASSGAAPEVHDDATTCLAL